MAKNTTKTGLELHEGALNVPEILSRWYNENKTRNYGAIITFVGVVRDEDGIEGLSFDIYEPLLLSWFEAWRKKANEAGADVLMAHSVGDVPNHQSSYVAGVISPKRKVALALINEFVEDFKASAPIWKYDLINNERVYALNRSTKIAGAGILS